MKLNSYTIYDSASGSYCRPFFNNADGAAVREFADIAHDKTHPIGKHPEHYSIWRNGIFDDQTGKYSPEKPEHMANAHELITQKADDDQPDLFESAGLTA